MCLWINMPLTLKHTVSRSVITKESVFDKNRAKHGWSIEEVIHLFRAIQSNPKCRDGECELWINLWWLDCRLYIKGFREYYVEKNFKATMFQSMVTYLGGDMEFILWRSLLVADGNKTQSVPITLSTLSIRLCNNVVIVPDVKMIYQYL